MRLAPPLILTALFLAACGSPPVAVEEPEQGETLSEPQDIVTPTDFGSLALGGIVQGPLGPEIEGSLIAGEAAIGNISSRVHCPEGMEACDPETAPEGTIYTYVYEIRPGFDAPNDEGFEMPDQILPVEHAQSFSLAFPAHGFTGVAGYDVEGAEAVLAEGINGVISCDTGMLSWTFPEEAGWSTGETITFFWQSTQPPGEPEGEYRFVADGREATGRGPMPVPGGEMPAVCG